MIDKISLIQKKFKMQLQLGHQLFLQDKSPLFPSPADDLNSSQQNLLGPTQNLIDLTCDQDTNDDGWMQNTIQLQLIPVLFPTNSDSSSELFKEICDLDVKKVQQVIFDLVDKIKQEKESKLSTILTGED